MRVFRSIAEVPSDLGPSAVAIGKFDGVHRGHSAILARLTAQASRAGVASVVVTFDRNPLEVLAPDRCPAELMPPERRMELFDEAGVGAVVVIPFTREFASRPPELFIEEVLVGALGARFVFAGRDFRFGHRGAGDIELLRRAGAERGFAVEAVAPVLVEGEPVSSTRIREALARGEVALAGRLLGRAPEVSGLVVPGLRRGRELGFPTANLGEGTAFGSRVRLAGLIPADGVYAGWMAVHGDGEGRRGGPPLPVAISVGTNPTFDGVPRTVEAYVLDRTLDLYGAPVTVRFAEFVRPMLRFDGVEALIAGMSDDVIRVGRILLGGD